MAAAPVGDVTTPAALRSLSAQQVGALCAKLRHELVHSVARRGGHLGPNLGVVELTVALHRSFSSPHDVIIWDTGHQAYIHKMLTGRLRRFDTLRTLDGVSGYPNRAESEHDWVENSHAGTSLSYAAGMATALASQPSQGRRQVVAVIGDGALGAGLALEALNDIADRRLDVIIVLNDNGRSYAPTTGAIATHLRNVRDGAPPELWRALGVDDLGPVDGHDVDALETVFATARARSGPVLVHVVTRKGRGYAPAEDDEVDCLHGVGRFDPLTGKAAGQPADHVSAGAVLCDTLCDLARNDPRLVFITPAMGSPSGMDRFRAAFPDRFIDVGIAEQHAVTLACGMAMMGNRPVVSIHSTFLNRAVDQLLFDVGLHRLPITVVVDRAGITGGDGPSHHGLLDVAILRHVPGMRIGCPSSAAEMDTLLRAAYAYDGPSAVRYCRSLPVAPTTVDGDVASGGWAVEEAPGGIAVIASGEMLSTGRAVVSAMRERGIPAACSNAAWLSPLPSCMADLAHRHSLLVTLEDHCVDGGLGSAVAERLGAEPGAPPILRVGVPAGYLPHGDVDDLRRRIGLDTVSVTTSVLRTWNAVARRGH